MLLWITAYVWENLFLSAIPLPKQCDQLHSTRKLQAAVAISGFISTHAAQKRIRTFQTTVSTRTIATLISELSSILACPFHSFNPLISFPNVSSALSLNIPLLRYMKCLSVSPVHCIRSLKRNTKIILLSGWVS